MKPSRWVVAALCAMLTIAVAVPAHAATTPRIGASCAVKGKRITVHSLRMQCVQRGAKLVWAKVMPTPKPTAARDPLEGDITVFAAASLTESFNEIANAFQTAHPKVHVTLSFGGSSGLATQINNGAPADVFASAAVSTMSQVVQSGMAATPRTFARNRLIIVTPPGNPAGITSVKDLAKSSVKVAVCQTQVPCGAVAKQVFTNAGVTVTPVTYEADVKSVLTKVLLGEVDAGLVYVTDGRSAGAAVATVVIPAEQNAETTYPIALLRSSVHPTVAQAFIDFVLGDSGAAALAAVGFTVL